MVKVSDIYGGDFLTAQDLSKQGRIQVTIKEAEEITFKDENKKILLTFKEFDKKLVLNKTNANKLIGLTGSDDSDDWKGQEIDLYLVQVQFQKNEVPSIRVGRRLNTDILKDDIQKRLQ